MQKVGCFGDFVHTVVARIEKTGFLPSTSSGRISTLRVRPSMGGRQMIEVYTDAHGLLVGPVSVGVDGLDAGPFKQTYHKAGSQY